MKRILFLSVFISVLFSCTKDENENFYVDEVLPPPVENFRAGTYEGHFTLFWDYLYQKDINYYVLEYNSGNNKDTIGAFESFYQMPDFIIDTTYFFLIRVVDKKGNFSEAKMLEVSK